MTARAATLVEPSPERLGRIAPAMQRYVEAGQVPGIVALVAQAGRVVHASCCGWQDAEARTPLRPDSIVRIYSMSKPITAVAALMLCDQGRLRLEDPIARYLGAFRRMRVLVGGTADAPELQDAEHPITIQHLLMHTAGLVYDNAAGSPVEQLYARTKVRDYGAPLGELARKLAALPLNHQPGQAWHYGFSIDLLGYVVEAVADQLLDEYLHERLFAPLGMADTGFAVPPSARDRYAVCYAPDGAGGLARVATPFDSGEAPAFLSGGGGLLSTAQDYGRFCQMLLNGGELDGVRILRPETVAQMATNHLPASWVPFVPTTWPFRAGYGMGLGVRTVVDEAAAGPVGRAGSFTWQGAAGTDFWVDPAASLWSVLMTQVLPGFYGPARTLRTILYGAD